VSSPRPRVFSVLLLGALAGCPDAKSQAPAPHGGTAAVGSAEGVAAPTTASTTELVPLDAADSLELPAPLAQRIAAARGKIPATLTGPQREALDEIECRYERLEAAALAEDEDDADDKEMQTHPAALGRILAGYYWERLRLFDRELDAEPPEELVRAFEVSTPRGR
jgi:hypothetical protein